MSEFPSMADFEPCVGTEFVIDASDQPDVSMSLEKLEIKISTTLQECFSLVFRAPADMTPVQQQFALRHAQLGTHSLFLVPFRQDAAGVYFEAVFNRLLR